MGQGEDSGLSSKVKRDNDNVYAKSKILPRASFFPLGSSPAVSSGTGVLLSAVVVASGCRAVDIDQDVVDVFRVVTEAGILRF